MIRLNPLTTYTITYYIVDRGSTEDHSEHDLNSSKKEITS